MQAWSVLEDLLDRMGTDFWRVALQLLMQLGELVLQGRYFLRRVDLGIKPIQDTCGEFFRAGFILQ